MSDSLLTKILNELTEIKADIKEIKTKTDNITFIKQAILETNQRTVIIEGYTKALLSSQSKQDKLLETLAIRSLEHETDIREIKRKN